MTPTDTVGGTGGWRERYPSLPYVAPFAAYVLLLPLQSQLPALAGRWESALRIAAAGCVLSLFSRTVLNFRVRRWGGSLGLGAAVFLVWIGPDFLFPYRNHWLFQNPLTGAFGSSLPENLRSDPSYLALRVLRSAVLVPVIEELFWRAWLMRWLISPRFRTIALGSWTRQSFWLTAVMFAAEHGPQWEVGLLAGIAYNWWMIRTRSLGDCILAHAVTNACLAAFVVLAGRWEYWY